MKGGSTPCFLNHQVTGGIAIIGLLIVTCSKKQFNGFPIAKIRLNLKASDLGTDDKSWKVNPRKLPL